MGVLVRRPRCIKRPGCAAWSQPGDVHFTISGVIDVPEIQARLSRPRSVKKINVGPAANRAAFPRWFDSWGAPNQGAAPHGERKHLLMLALVLAAAWVMAVALGPVDP